MATLYPAADGTLLQALLSGAEEARSPAAPAGTGTPLVFDHATNPALVADLRRSTDPYRLAAGVLSKGGVPVPINPPDPAVAERATATADLRDQYAAMLARLDALVNDATTTDTAAKVRQAVIDLARFQRRALRLLKSQVS